jgi:predicted dehydrogenase
MSVSDYPAAGAIMSADQTTVDRALVVGHGYAGKRFVTALRHLAGAGAPVELVGVCDRSATRLPAGVAGFTDLADALRTLRPSVICVTVNESDHLAVYEQLASYHRALVISEKPLTTDSRHIDRAREVLGGHCFAMNLVERFSPVVREYRRWARSHGSLDVVRVETFWGKHRVGDPRPTIGVLSELVHSLDLVRYLFLPGKLRILGGHGVESDFSPHSAAILDTVDVHAAMGEIPVLMRSSYAWPTRQRIVTALLWSARGGLIRVKLEFDIPHWDCDRLEISTIAPDGHWERVHNLATHVSSLPAAIRGVGKVVSFVESSLSTWRGHGVTDEHVDLATAAELQEITDEIDRAIDRSGTPARYQRHSQCVKAS